MHGAFLTIADPLSSMGKFSVILRTKTGLPAVGRQYFAFEAGAAKLPG